MNIVFVSSGAPSSHEDFQTPNLSGTQSQIFGNAKVLSDMDHEISILSRGRGDSVSVSGVEIINIDPPRFPDDSIENVFTQILFSLKARQLIHSISPDVVVIMMKYSSIFTCTLDVPVVLFAFNNAVENISGQPRIKRLITGNAEKWVLSNSDAIVVRNEQMKSYISEFYEKDKVYKIPSGVDLNKYKNNGNENFIMYGGRLSKEKNIQSLIRAFKMLPEALLSDYSLEIVGEGGQRQELKKLVRRTGIGDKITLSGWLPKKSYIKKLSKSTLFVLPSLREGMPVSLLEAMACSKPVVGSNVPGIKDVISNGDNGILIDPNNPRSIAQAIEDLCRKDKFRNNVRHDARASIVSDYGFETTGEKYAQLFDRLLSK